MNTRQPIYTIGHSSQPIEAFIAQLQAHGIELVADVRSSPYSRRYPHFSREALQKSLAVAAIRYLFLGRELGARRDEPECYVNDRTSHEVIAKLPNFVRGIERVLDAAEEFRVALMCAEQDPLACHRTILVCRELSRHGASIRHIGHSAALEEHADAERRLIAEELGDGDQGELFAPAGDADARLQQAYSARASRIAHRRGPATR